MFTLRRWWNRHGSQLLWVGVLLAIAWGIRQTQAAGIYELYYWFVSPWQQEVVEQTPIEDIRLLELYDRLRALEAQNQQLQAQLGYQQQHREAIAAPLIGRSPDRWWQQVVLGVGSRQGVREGWVVTGVGGLVGRVTGVTPHTCRVLLLSDPASRVGVSIARSRQMGVMRGEGDSRATLRFFEKGPDVSIGDVVVTSPVSHLYPSGIPLGRVVEVNLEKSPAPEAIIELSAPIGRLEWAFVESGKAEGKL